jgi:quinol monooxygenase YgiN
MGYVVNAHYTVKEGNEDAVLAALAELAPISREEAANQLYKVYRDPAEPQLIHLFEIYDDETGYQAHIDSEHFKRLGFGTVIPLLEKRERAFFEILDI